MDPKMPVKLPKITPQLLWKLFIWAFSISGFMLQVITISSQYFQYKTVTKMTMTRQSKVFPPAVSVCRNLAFVNKKCVQCQNMTLIKDLWDDVFHPNWTIDRLEYRKFPGNYRAKASKELKKNFFHISKFMKLKFGCYGLKMRQSWSFDRYDLMNNLDRPRFYHIYFDKPLPYHLRTIYFYFHSNTTDLYGDADSYFQAELFSNKGILSIYVALTYVEFHSFLKEPPYDTKCLNYTKHTPFQSAGQCFESCFWKKSYQQFNKVPFNVYVDKPYKLHRVGKKDLTNDSFAIQFRRVKEECKARCNRADCLKYDFTPFLVSLKRNNGVSLNKTEVSFSLFASNFPLFRVESGPQLSTIDYITYSLSCLSFWFAFSPVTFFIRQRDKKSKKISLASPISVASTSLSDWQMPVMRRQRSENQIRNQSQPKRSPIFSTPPSREELNNRFAFTYGGFLERNTGIAMSK